MDPSMISRGDVRGGAIPVCGLNEVKRLGTKCTRKCDSRMEFPVNGMMDERRPHGRTFEKSEPRVMRMMGWVLNSES